MVVLHFVEPSLAAGKRTFDVEINGKTVLSGFDVASAAGGALKAVDRAFPAVAGKDGIAIAFKPRVGDAIVSAIEILPAAGKR